jgi:3-methyladenine DNA glycosylase AlkD
MSTKDRAAQLVLEVRSYCAAHADPKMATKWSRYFTEGYDAWGLVDGKHPFWNEQQEAWLTAFGDLKIRGFLQAGELLFESGKYEEGAIAIRFLAKHREHLDAKSVPALGKWFAAGVRNWAHTDVLCGEVISPLLASGQVRMEALAAWRGSTLKFQRRAVPVAMLGLLKSKPDPRPLLEFIRPLMMDPERVVQQGLGWFLRETWKICPAPVEAFLLEWRNEAPRLIFQYATEKMPTAHRARFRREKKR